MNAPAPDSRAARWLLFAGALCVPVSLLWDFAWESTVGIDLLWAAPHVLTYCGVVLSAIAAIWMIVVGKDGVALGKMRAPAGAWLALWGTVAFLAAFLFDRWWQASYGLAAGLWHPPQIAKATAFFAIAIGAWWCVPRWGGGIVIALIATVAIAQSIANRQHDPIFYHLACGAYPVVLAAAALSGGGRFPATRAALIGMAVHLAAVWLLPLIPGTPETGPIYNPRTHLLPPPFPPLIIIPAIAFDWLLRSRKSPGWFSACELGLAFFLFFAVPQWQFAKFLLTPAADNAFFAGGGTQWPFFFRISDDMRTAFWPGEHMGKRNAAIAIGIAGISAGIGLALGKWLARLRR